MERFRALPPNSLNVLCFAALLGEEFALDELLIVAEGVESELKTGLLNLCHQGIIVPLMERSLQFLKVSDDFITNAKFRFTHGKVRDAAESLLGPKRRAKVHYNIGKAQMAYLSEEQLNDRIYEVVHHYNEALELEGIKDLKLIELNYKAAQKAHHSSANKAAIGYLKKALPAIDDEAWKDHYQLSCDVYKLLAVVSFLAKDREMMSLAIQTVKQKAQVQSDLIDILEVEIHYIMTYDKDAAIELAVNVFKKLDFAISSHPSNGDVALSFIQTLVAIRRRPLVATLRKLQ